MKSKVFNSFQKGLNTYIARPSWGVTEITKSIGDKVVLVTTIPREKDTVMTAEQLKQFAETN